MFITVIMEFIIRLVGELVDFWRKRVSLLKHALAEGHLFFYNLLVVIKSMASTFAESRNCIGHQHILMHFQNGIFQLQVHLRLHGILLNRKFTYGFMEFY